MTPPRAASWADPAWRTLLATLSPAGAPARLSIVIFHRVLPEPDPLFPGDPDQRHFAELCRRFAAWFNVLPLDEAVERLQAGSLPARALAITFDDGYADNHDLAMPILRAHGLCATFFIATGFLDGGRMWNDTIVEAIRHRQGADLDLSPLALPGVDRLDLSTLEARRGAVDRVLMACKYLPLATRVAMSESIAELAQVAPARDLMMSSDQVRAMAAGGMQIGAHTIHHPILARLDDTEARTEIARGKADLEALLGQPVTLFAYPNGKPGNDYTPRDVGIVQAAGFRAAVSTAPGAAGIRTAVLHELPRFTPWDRERSRFALRMARNLAAARRAG